MTATICYNDIADLLAECRQPDHPDAEPWPNPDNFLQYEYAADAQRRALRPTHPEAAGWCPVGRIQNIAYTDPDSGALCYYEDAVNAALRELHAAMQEIEPEPQAYNAMMWNDRKGRRSGQVAEAFDLAIANCRRKGVQPIKR